MSRIHLIGAGSIGTVFAHHLAAAGHPTTLLLRTPAALAALEAQQGRLIVEVRQPESPQPQLRSSVVSAEVAAAAADDARLRRQQQMISKLIVTTKAHHAVAALSSVRHRLDNQSVVVLLQNGVLGVYLEAVQTLFPSASSRPAFLLGSTTHGAYRPAGGAFHVVHASPGTGTALFGQPPAGLQAEAEQNIIIISSSSSPGARLDAQVSTQAGCSQQPEKQQQQLQADDYHQQQRRNVQDTLTVLSSIQELHPTVLSPEQLHQQLLLKLLINVCANPLSGLLHCRNGGLVGNPVAEEIWRHLIHEFCQVFAADLASSSSQQGGGANDLPLEQQLFQRVRHVVDINSTNVNSMLQSVMKREETEVDYINGFVVREGAGRGVATPWNDMLLKLIKAREAVPAHYLTHEQL